MTRTTAPYQSTTHEVAAVDRVVVAVDAHDPSPGAALWAAREAGRLGVPLQLVCASAYPTTRGDPEAPFLERRDRRQVEALAHRLTRDVDVLPLEISAGPPMSVVLDHVDDRTHLLVVGHRDLGAARRALSGSMSIAIAGRSPVPVVVVPDGWAAATHASASVVAGASLHDEGVDAVGDVVVLEHAFGRARELNVPLEVVHACEIPPLLSWSPNDIAESQQRASAALALCLAPLRARYPDVEVSTQVVAERPSDALREAPRAAQLIVLGRHKSATRHGGFHSQSTARQLLHRLTVPVLVLPTPMTGQNHLAHERLDTWAPIY